jgi:AraC-like DNA-binding protein
MRELTIAAGAVRALMDFAISRGARRETLAERSLIDPSDLRDRDHRVPFSKYVLLMRAGQELCGDPALALHFGEAVPVSAISLVHMVGASSETMAEGLALMNRYAPLTVEVDIVGAGDRFVFERDEGEVWVIDRRENPNDFPELTESAFARVITTSRQHLGDKSFLKAVHVTHAEPPYRAEYERIFLVPVVFRLGLSRQSLFRKLKAEGVTFEEVLHGLRHTLALRYLNGEGLSVKETAFRLGFSEPASFSRAFKRWTGTSPLVLRRTGRGASGRI